MTIYLDITSKHSIDKAMVNITSYANRVMRLKEELPRVLAEYGVTRARARYSEGTYDLLISGQFSTPNITVTAEQRENGWAVVANGKEVCFVEFGAGVYYTGGESYLGTRPPGIVGIGQFGKGHGKQDSWGFKDENGEVYITHGTPANNTLYFTAREMREYIEEAARRILNGND